MTEDSSASSAAIGVTPATLSQARCSKQRDEFSTVHCNCAGLQRDLAFRGVDVVVISLERSPALADRRSERMQLLVALIGDEVRPESAAPRPTRFVNQNRHDRPRQEATACLRPLITGLPRRQISSGKRVFAARID